MDGKHQTAKRPVQEQRGGGADDAEPPSQRRRVAALREVCEETEPANFYEARLKHIAKLTKNDAKIVGGTEGGGNVETSVGTLGGNSA